MNPFYRPKLTSLRLATSTIFLLSALIARASYSISYIELNPLGGSVCSASETQLIGFAEYAQYPLSGEYATIWSGPSHSVINLNPLGAVTSIAYASSGNQQVGSVWFGSYQDAPAYAALWNGSAASFRNLNPPGGLSSYAYGTSGTQQVGVVNFGPPSWRVAAALWYGTAESFIDLTPPNTYATVQAVAAGQQAGWTSDPKGVHAAIWSGTAASYKDLNPPGASGSELFATTGTRQAGWADGHAGLWSGTPESFLDLNPAGAWESKVVATTGTLQAGWVVFDLDSRRRHAVIWFGSATNFIDLDASFPVNTYWHSEAWSVWSDGTNIIVGGNAVPVGPEGARPMVWTLTRQECRLICPANITVCNDRSQCGAVVHFDPPSTTNCDNSVVTCIPPSGSFFPTGTNTVQCAVSDATGQTSDNCSFEVVVQDCEPPEIQNIAASPNVLWPPNGKMQPVTINVSATDNCHLATSKIISVTSDEASPKGTKNPGWQITGDLTLNLRADRSPTGTERIYTITVECVDTSGNSSTAVTYVNVPHSLRTKRVDRTIPREGN